MTDTPAEHPTGPDPTAAPSTGARVVAFLAIVLGGAAGGFIGWAIVDLQCSGDCALQAALAALVGAVATAIGVGIVVVLAMRAMAEWQADPDRRSRERAGADPTRRPGSPRVR